MIKKSKLTKIRKGDEVKVVTGKDRGKTAQVERVLVKSNKVIVANINQYKRHLKARAQNQPSEIITLVKPMPVSNVSLICSSCKLPTRVRFIVEADKKIRTCKKCSARI